MHNSPILCLHGSIPEIWVWGIRLAIQNDNSQTVDPKLSYTPAPKTLRAGSPGIQRDLRRGTHHACTAERLRQCTRIRGFVFAVGGFGYAEPPDEDWNQVRLGVGIASTQF